MRQLAHGRVYSRDAVLRALRAAGQFAHVPLDQFEGDLDALYDSGERERCAGYVGRDAEERAVPIVLARAHAGGFAKQCFDGEVVSYIALKRGVVCCLCLAIETPNPSDHPAPNGFLAMVCPTFLAVTGYGHNETGQPLCVKCRRAVAGRIGRCYGFKVPNQDDTWASLLAWLLLNDGLRSRVVAFADNLRLLRFDPRRPNTQGLAA